MKKTLFPAAIALVALLAASPETAAAGLLRKAGAKIAFSSAGQAYELAPVPEAETDRRFGVGFAVFGEWIDMPVLSLVTQVEYLPRGMAQDFIIPGSLGEALGTISIDNRLDYISIPVLAKGRLDLGSVSPYALAGVRFDFLVGYESDGGVFDEVYSAFDDATVGASVGAGVEFAELLPTGLIVEFRYNMDLDDAYSTDQLKVSNNSYDIWLGVTF